MDDMDFLFVLYDKMSKMSIVECEMWVIDSAASNHFTAMRDNIRNFKESLPVKVLTENGIILGLGRGDIMFKLATKLSDRLVRDMI